MFGSQEISLLLILTSASIEQSLANAVITPGPERLNMLCAEDADGDARWLAADAGGVWW